MSEPAPAALRGGQVYVALLRRPGARVLSLACTLGWLGFAATGLAIVLLVEAESGSFARAGLAVGLFSAGAGLFAPLRGRLVDRVGAPALVAFAASQCALLLVVVWTASPLVAGLAGAVAPPLIATARTVWPRVAGPELTRAGHGLNALLGDIGTVLGPALAGGLVALAGPQVALAAFACGPLAGALLVARHPALPPRERTPRRAPTAAASPAPAVAHRRGSPFSPGLVTLLVAELALGVSAGAIDVAAPALAGGAPGLSALALSAMAVGSIFGSLWGGQSTIAADRRFVAGVVGMAVALAGCAFVTSSYALAAVLLLAGVGYGVFNVGVFELLDVVVPSHRAVEALTWLTTAGSLGMAAGAAAAGQLAHESPRSALVLVAVATAPGAVIALGRRRTLTTARR
ncbi:putative MFS family arabinose efflux permease [Solirubrobacter pauli]|uniref:Putative MFS family arabinose efflux permease n=1 Tax=Solirubrobacter pauli TaxID=166793 RepID=A0A660L414_9ACTN|nr:MFS transporter [Solirubrobacter pauli]RKQ87669.1 putative MFS family arabinose efflux permease [Solirubrobacter pauli]